MEGWSYWTSSRKARVLGSEASWEPGRHTKKKEKAKNRKHKTRHSK